MQAIPIVQLIRPKHWIKNIVVLLPILSALKFNEPHAAVQIGLAFIAFCFTSSLVYILNDIHDRESDRFFIHTHNRPLASNRISVSAALTAAFGCAVIALATAALTSFGVILIISGYLLIQIAYTWYLKQKVLWDVICIASGFVLRAAAGAAAIHVFLSP